MPKTPSHSPKRRPLHERSDSQTNWLGMSTPSIRMVTESDEDEFDEEDRRLHQRLQEEHERQRQIYTANPFPSQPSQILSPRTRRVAGRSSGQGLGLELNEGPSSPTSETVVPPLVGDTTPTASATSALAVDDSARPSLTTSKPPSSPSPPPRSAKRVSPPQRQEAFKDGRTSGPASSATASISTEPAISRSRETSKAASTASKSASISQASTRASTQASTQASITVPVQSPKEGVAGRFLSNRRERTTSVASSASSETLQGRRHHDRSGAPSSTNSPFPFSPARSTFSKASGARTPPLPTEPFSSDFPEPLRLTTTNKTEEGYRSTSSRSIPGQATSEPAEFGTALIQYPVIKAAAPKGSWADSSIYIPKKRRMLDRASAEPLRLNPVTPPADPIWQQQSGKDIGNGITIPVQQKPSSSSLAVEVSSGSASSDPAKAGKRAKGKTAVRNWSYRDPVGQENSTDSGTDGRPLRRKTAFGRSSLDPNPPQLPPLGVQTPSRPSKRFTSFPNISQYLREAAERDETDEERQERIRTGGIRRVDHSDTLTVPSGGAPGSSTEEPTDSSSPAGSPINDNMPLSIYRPRGRRSLSPRVQIQGQDDSILPIPATTTTTAAPSVLDRRERVRYSEPNWSPRLMHDRRATVVSIWEAPRIESTTDGNMFSRGNIQLVLFSFGFIFPFAWWLASFIPLPPNPMKADEKDYARQSQLEAHFARQLDPIDEARYENTRWWRNLNRIMSVIGALLIGAIIALVIVAVRMRNSS